MNGHIAKVVFWPNSKIKMDIQDFYFILPSPRLLKKGSRLDMSTKRSSNCGLMSNVNDKKADFQKLLSGSVDYLIHIVQLSVTYGLEHNDYWDTQRKER